MRKRIYVVLSLIFILTACNKVQIQTKVQRNNQSSVASVLEQQMNLLTPTAEPVIIEGQPTMDIFSLIPMNAPTPIVMDMEELMAMSADADVDIDLTKLSSTMVYSQVYSMIDTPDRYVGKTVRMTGQFSVFEPTDQNGQPIPDLIYLSCVVLDATACCQQGIEFTLSGNAVYPDDYPEPDSMITVVGELEVYEEGPFRFLRLKDAHFEA